MTEINEARLKWDLRRGSPERFSAYWNLRQVELIPRSIFQNNASVVLEIGAGSGWFCTQLAQSYPEKFVVAIERDRMRGNTLVQKASRSGLKNLAAFRGNAIPVLVNGIPSQSVECVYILYPCPWTRNAQRRNRWYLHPIMPHIVRILKPGGRIVWASDQKFFIDEARFVCEMKYDLVPLIHGPLEPNAFNELAAFPGGRTKFETTFLQQGLPCYELIVEKKIAVTQ
jgi:tRNA (guanine-N7-)-methyltransferase